MLIWVETSVASGSAGQLNTRRGRGDGQPTAATPQAALCIGTLCGQVTCASEMRATITMVWTHWGDPCDPCTHAQVHSALLSPVAGVGPCGLQPCACEKATWAVLLRLPTSSRVLRCAGSAAALCGRPAVACSRTSCLSPGARGWHQAPAITTVAPLPSSLAAAITPAPAAAAGALTVPVHTTPPALACCAVTCSLPATA